MVVKNDVIFEKPLSLLSRWRHFLTTLFDNLLFNYSHIISFNRSISQSGSDSNDLPAAKETDIGGDNKHIDSDSGCVIQWNQKWVLVWFLEINSEFLCFNEISSDFLLINEIYSDSRLFSVHLKTISQFGLKMFGDWIYF